MNMKKFALIMTVVCLAARASFGDVWQDLAKYKYGAGNTGDEAEKLLQKTPVAQHGAIEDSLIAVVSSPEATQDGKACACRMLQQIGTEKCIPAVAGLLKDEVLSHYARLVFERMGNPKADAAMRAALDTAPDTLKVGLMGSLGARRDDKAVKQIQKLAVNGDPAVASAAIGALGRIGGSSSASFLRKLKPAESLQTVYLIALLDCARTVKGSDAMPLYELVLAGKTPQRVGALTGMLAADEKKAVALMVDSIKGNDGEMFSSVLTVVGGEKSDRLTQAMAELVGSLPDAKKAALITSLGARGDKAALGSIVPCLNSTNTVVRAAALMAVAKIADQSSVKLLLGLNGGSTDQIAMMPASGVNEALIKALADNKLKVPAIGALVARNCVGAVPVFFELINDEDAAVRKTAWNALGSMASENDIAPMAKAAFSLKDQAELSEAMAAIRSACAHAKDKAKAFDVVAAYYDGTTDPAKAAIVDMASQAGSPSALELVKKAMQSGNKEIYRNGVRSLADWSNESAASELLALAKGAPEETDRTLALRGYIRIAGMDNVSLNEEQRAAMFQQASELATRVEEKKMIIGGLHRAPTPVSLALVNKYIDEPALRDEAEQFAVNIVEHLRRTGPQDEVKELATKLLTSKNQDIVNRAKNTLANLGK